MFSSSIRRKDWSELKPTVAGWGINDVNYTVQTKETLPKQNGKRRHKQVWVCPYYRDWVDMINRCFSQREKIRSPTYHDCTVCEEWRYLSNFIKWVDSQPNKNWQNCHLDKDVLSPFNKEYNPSTTIYISRLLNNFTTNRGRSRGLLMLGVKTQTSSKINPYVARCCNPLSNQRDTIGYFKTELEAHKAWQAKKHEHACKLADLQEDERVAKALRERYAPDKDWTKI